MTVTEQIAFLKDYRGETRQDSDFTRLWRGVMDSDIPQPSFEREDLGNPLAVYETMRLSHGGRTLTARCIHPADGKRHPLVLMYHDLNRGVRGWHHMTRFLAFGFGVAALAAEPFPGDWKRSDPDFFGRYTDALVFGKAALELPWVDAGQIVAFGEGFGGGLALAAAAMLPGIDRLAALNPFPGDFRGMGREDMGKVDLVHFAPLFHGQALVGTCLMDAYAPPRAQAAICNGLGGEKLWRIYPKYTHERVNAFENDLVCFLKDGLSAVPSAQNRRPEMRE